MTDAPETAAPPADVAAQRARYDRHADDRVRLAGLAAGARLHGTPARRMLA